MEKKVIRRERTDGLLPNRIVVDQAKALHKGDVAKQVRYLVQNIDIPAATGRARTVSYKTRHNYQRDLSFFVETMSRLGKRPQAIDQISSKLFVEVLENWKKDGMSPGTLANRKTAAKRFLAWVGRVHDAEMLEKFDVGERGATATESKSWSEAGVSPEEVIEKVEAEDKYVGNQLRLMKEFGLRVSEAVVMRPKTADLGDRLWIKDGAKGGRPRVVPIDNEEKRRVLDKAIELARGNSMGTATQKGYNLIQAKKRVYNVTAKHGITESALGVKLHGLRHEFAANVFRDHAGEDPPVEGGMHVDPVRANAARAIVTKQLGHSRLSITSAYLGSENSMNKHAKERLMRLSALVEGSEILFAIGKRIGIEEVTFVGQIATGARPAKGRLVVAGIADAVMKQIMGSDEATETLAEFNRALSDTIGEKCTVVMNKFVEDEKATFTMFLGRGADAKEALGISRVVDYPAGRVGREARGL